VRPAYAQSLHGCSEYTRAGSLRPLLTRLLRIRACVVRQALSHAVRPAYAQSLHGCSEYARAGSLRPLL